MTEEELQHARKLIEQDRREREAACGREIAAALERNRCALVVVAQNTDGPMPSLMPAVRALA